jgi:ubiquinone biosynthesis protein
MVMVEGIATQLDPQINMWDVAAPYVGGWIRDELGPEAVLAEGLKKQAQTLALIPDIIRRLDAQLPKPGGAPPAPPLPDVKLVWERGPRSAWWRYAFTAAVAAVASAAAALQLG